MRGPILLAWPQAMTRTSPFKEVGFSLEAPLRGLPCWDSAPALCVPGRGLVGLGRPISPPTHPSGQALTIWKSWWPPLLVHGALVRLSSPAAHISRSWVNHGNGISGGSDLLSPSAGSPGSLLLEKLCHRPRSLAACRSPYARGWLVTGTTTTAPACVQ